MLEQSSLCVEPYLKSSPKMNPCSAELYVYIFRSFEARTANAISSFKWKKKILKNQRLKLNYMINGAYNTRYMYATNFSWILFILEFAWNCIYAFQQRQVNLSIGLTSHVCWELYISSIAWLLMRHLIRPDPLVCVLGRSLLGVHVSPGNLGQTVEISYLYSLLGNPWCTMLV